MRLKIIINFVGTVNKTSMKLVTLSCAFYPLLTVVLSFWDDGTTTSRGAITDNTPRQSFFRWQETQPEWKWLFFMGWDWATLRQNRRLCTVAGISIDFLCLGTATLLNRRTLITSANFLEPYHNRMLDLRIWALGAYGMYNTPYRYRVWRFTRLLPRSLNPEHWHGPRGLHIPRHDVAIVHSLDQIYLMNYYSSRGHYAYRSMVCPKFQQLTWDMWYAGSGYQYLKHIKENYKIFIDKMYRSDVVDCSKFLPKYWGKFICFKNVRSWPGVQNGGGLHIQPARGDTIAALGCFEIRYNEERIVVFTDLRYYHDLIYLKAELWRPGEYYEYAYPQWGVHRGLVFDSGNSPRIPWWQIQYDFYPLGKK